MGAIRLRPFLEEDILVALKLVLFFSTIKGITFAQILEQKAQTTINNKRKLTLMNH